MAFSVGDEIYKIKYIGNNLQADTHKSYIIHQVYQWTSDNGIHTMGTLDNGTVFELEFYDISAQIHSSYAKHVSRYRICCVCWI